MYPLLQEGNPQRGALTPGREVKVPPIEDALSDPLLVREGESLWNLAIRLYGNPQAIPEPTSATQAYVRESRPHLSVFENKTARIRPSSTEAKSLNASNV